MSAALKKLPPALREMLERVQADTDKNGAALYAAIAAPSMRKANKVRKLKLAGYIEMMPHPTMKSGISGQPATAVRITSAGRHALRTEEHRITKLSPAQQEMLERIQAHTDESVSIGFESWVLPHFW